MYTYDFGSKDFESNPYRIISRRNFAEMQRASGLLYLVMSALRKLSRVTGRTLYRGVRGEVSLDSGYYHRGDVVTWNALSSTSPDMEATKHSLRRGPRVKRRQGRCSSSSTRGGATISSRTRCSLTKRRSSLSQRGSSGWLLCSRLRSQSSTSRCWTRCCQSPGCLGEVVGANGKGTKHNFPLFRFFRFSRK